MGHLELRFDKQHLGTELSLGVVTRLRQVKDATGKFPDDPVDQELVIPAGASGRAFATVPAGTYRIEARLPSGEVLRETRTVTDSPQGVEVIFKGSSSPREWLSWQRLAGNVPSQEQYEGWINELAEQIVKAANARESAAKPIQIDPTVIRKLATQARELHLKLQPTIQAFGRFFGKVMAGSDADSGPADTQPTPQAAVEPVEFELVQADPRAAEALWDAVSSPTAWTEWKRTASPYVAQAIHRTDDRQLTLWRIEQSERIANNVVGPSGAYLPLRCLAVMQRGRGVDVITLPVPWPLDPYLPAPDLEVLREAGTSDSGRTTTTVRDNVVGGLLMYLNNGQMRDAATVLIEAQRKGLIEELMSEKARNPLAACAAAYVGLATLSDNQNPRWAPWLKNLKDWFPWLPDGAIVHGAYVMQSAKTRDDLRDALASLKDAYRRGIPFYTAGFRHLMNGLYAFSDEDAEAKAMHEKVASIAARVDPNQAFNQITIAAPPPSQAVK